MKAYLLAHWRGELSLARTFWLNGALAYLVLVLILVGMGQMITAIGFFYVGMVCFLACLVWSLTGIVRCSVRIVRAETSSITSKFWAYSAIVFVVLVVWTSAKDLSLLLG